MLVLNQRGGGAAQLVNSFVYCCFASSASSSRGWPCFGCTVMVDVVELPVATSHLCRRRCQAAGERRSSSSSSCRRPGLLDLRRRRAAAGHISSPLPSSSRRHTSPSSRKRRAAAMSSWPIVMASRRAVPLAACMSSSSYVEPPDFPTSLIQSSLELTIGIHPSATT